MVCLRRVIQKVLYGKTRIRWFLLRISTARDSGRGTQKHVTLYLPITSQSSTVNIVVQLLDSYGKVVQSQSVLLHQLYPGDAFVGLLSDQMNGFDALRNVVLPNSSDSMLVEYLNATEHALHGSCIG